MPRIVEIAPHPPCHAERSEASRLQSTTFAPCQYAGTNNMNLPSWLETTSRNHPDKLALTFGEERWTFAELYRHVNAAAETLTSALPDPPGRIGILSANRPGFVLAVLAAVRLGIPVVPLNPRLSPAELAFQIADADITLLLADETHDAAAVAQSSRNLAVIPISSIENRPEKTLPSPCAQGEGLGVRVNLTAEAAVFYTSGTSGRPKGAILTYGNLWFSAISSVLHLGHRSHDVWLLTMPLFHVGGLAILFRSIIGATPVILHVRFDPQRALHAIDAGAALVSLVPAMLDRMLALRNDRPWPPHLRCILLGGSAAPPQLLETCLRLGIPVAPTYGLTEATSQVATLLPEQVQAHLGSSGRPLPLTDIRIVTEHGEAPPGAVGEIEIRGPTNFRGYLGDSEARDPDAWFATGDIGYLDDDGYLVVVDRRHDLIISGGENVYPAEIERVLRSHPLVADAGVVGIPHETWGARPIAVVVWRGDPTHADPELRRHCATELSSFKIPDRFVLATELPRTPSGKLLRRVLSEHIAPARRGN